MNNLYQVLRKKEMDFERVRREIEALQFVIPLLTDDAERQASPVSAIQSRRSGTAGSKRWSGEREPFSI